MTGGRARGIPLIAPRGEVRPATDRLREAVFSSLGPSVEGARVLDLFAGSGAYGLEALSRRARSCLFVEFSAHGISAIERNLAAVARSCGEGLDARLLRADAFVFEPGGASFDLLFADPPYDLARARGSELLDRLRPAASEAARLVFELPGDLSLPEHPCWRLRKRLGKGKGQPTACLFEAG